MREAIQIARRISEVERQLQRLSANRHRSPIEEAELMSLRIEQVENRLSIALFEELVLR